MAKRKLSLHAVGSEPNVDPPPAIPKPPSGSTLDRFKSKKAPTVAGVGTLQGALPHHPLSAAKDFVRLHADEVNYWSPELCFVNVPILGMKRDLLHLIDEDLALEYHGNGKLVRFRLALASKPHHNFFLAHIPSTNLDNPWNISVLSAAEHSKTKWVSVVSRKAEGVESYKVDFARDIDAFPDPKWPSQTLDTLISVTFVDRMIEREDHPALLRLIGAKQALS
jgi:hypothetical protein